MKYFRSGQYPIEFVLTENINKEFSSHNHASHYIISLCIKGRVTATLENKFLLLKENDFFAVPPFMPHAVSLTDTSALVSLCMDNSFIEDYSSQKGAEILEMLLLSPKIQKRITKFQTERLLQAVPCVYELHDTHKKEMENDMLILSDRLINHFSDSLPLDDLARDLYLSKYYLIRKCKRNLGLTPHKFHLQNRIRKAQTLLLTNKSVTEASIDTGFYDQSHFDRSFKNIVGISPTEYSFTGVELKHILTSKETNGAYSYHLVRIAPDCSIGEHIHETQLETHEVIAGNGTCINKGTTIPYEPGVISVFPAGIPHAVNAGKDGLYLFAKFMPALC